MRESLRALDVTMVRREKQHINTLIEIGTLCKKKQTLQALFYQAPQPLCAPSIQDPSRFRNFRFKVQEVGGGGC